MFDLIPRSHYREKEFRLLSSSFFLKQNKMQFFVELQFTTQNETQNMVYKHLLVIFFGKGY